MPSFGGFITNITECTCSGGSMLTIQEPNRSSIDIVFQTGVSSLKSYHNPTYGSNVLGKFVYGGTCMVYYGIVCTSSGSPSGTIWYMGTSK